MKLALWFNKSGKALQLNLCFRKKIQFLRAHS